jgi:uncharacterized protein
MNVFLDANILFSAANDKSATRQLVIGLSTLAEAITNHHAWEEANRNLLMKRPNQTNGLNDLLKYITISNAFINTTMNELPEKDIPIIAGAMGSQSTYLWTGDKRHFGKWYGKKLNGVIVVSSIMLTDILIKMGWKP